VPDEELSMAETLVLDQGLPPPVGSTVLFQSTQPVGEPVMLQPGIEDQLPLVDVQHEDAVTLELPADVDVCVSLNELDELGMGLTVAVSVAVIVLFWNGALEVLSASAVVLPLQQLVSVNVILLVMVEVARMLVTVVLKVSEEDHPVGTGGAPPVPVPVAAPVPVP
jgi:hypothetical protein